MLWETPKEQAKLAENSTLEAWVDDKIQFFVRIVDFSNYINLKRNTEYIHTTYI